MALDTIVHCQPKILTHFAASDALEKSQCQLDVENADQQQAKFSKEKKKNTHVFFFKKKKKVKKKKKLRKKG